MALFNSEQKAAIVAVGSALSILNQATSDAQDFLFGLRRLDEESLVNGNADGPAIFDAAVIKWTELKGKVQVAATALP